MAFLGKISAVLTANTQDFTRGVREAGKDLEAFRKQTAGFQLNLSTDSLTKTLTKLQVFQRQVDEIRKQIAANPSQASLFPDPDKMMGQFKALQDVGKPLTDLKNKIEGLSTSLQAGLYPELGKIQKGFQNLHNAIGSGDTKYEKEEARVNNLTAALRRLGRTAAIAGDFGGLSKSLDADKTGASFYNPRTKDALQATLALRGRSEQVPAKYRGGVFADMSQQAEVNAKAIEDEIARLLRLENIIARGRKSPGILQARDASQGRLSSLTTKQEYLNVKYKRELTTADLAETVDAGKRPEIDSLKVQFQSLSGVLREINGTRFEPLINSVGLVLEKLNRGEASAKAARAAIASLAGAASVSDMVGGMEGKSAGTFRSKSSFDREAIRQQGMREREALLKNPELTGEQRDSMGRLSKVRENAALAREEFNRTTLPRFENLQAIGSGVQDKGLQKELENIKRLSMDVDAELRRAFSAEQSKDAEAALARYEGKLAALSPLYDRIEKKAKSLSNAQKQADAFRAASGGKGDKLDPVLERAASDIMVARQFRGQYAENNITGRSKVGDAIEDTTKRVEDLTRQRARIEGQNRPEEVKIRAYQKINQLIKEETELLLKLTAAESGGVFKQGRVMAAAERARKNTGSFGVPGAAAAQLAMQQGLFAIDDLMSATGGLEYKLRAVGNNITQLGLLLGQSGLIPGLSATTGLFIGLTAVMGGQALSALLRWVTGSEEATARVDAMNDSLAKQKSLVESLGQAFKSLGDSVTQGTRSAAGERDSGFKKQMDDIRQKQKESGREKAASLDPEVNKERIRQRMLEKRLENATDVGQRTSILAEIDASKQREQVAANGAVQRARVRAAGGGIAEAKRIEGLIAEKSKLASEDRGFMNMGRTFDISKAREEVEELQKTLNALNAGIEAEFARASNEIVEATRGPADEIRQAQQEVAKAIESGVPGARMFGLELDKTAQQLDEAYKKLKLATEGKDAEGNRISATQRDELIKQAKAEVNSLEERRNKIGDRAEAMRTARMVDPQVLIDERLQRARQNLGESGASNGGIARRIREIEARREEIRARAAMSDYQNPRDQAKFQAMEEALNKEVAAIESTTIALKMFAEAIGKASEEAKANLGAAQGRYDQARRNDLANGTAQSQQERAIAEFDLGRQKQIESFTQKALQVQGAFEEEAKRGPEFARMQQIDEQLKSGGGSAVQRGLLLAERAMLEEKVRPQIEASRRRAEAIAEAGTREEESQKKAARGRELMRTPEQRFSDETAAGLESIRESFKREGVRTGIFDAAGLAAEEERYRRSREKEARASTMAGRGREMFLSDSERFARDIRDQGGLVESMTAGAIDQAGLMNVQGRADLLRKGISNQMEQVAPMLKQFEDERANARLLGPSRAALGVNDVATGQGASELTRLLRQDDSARDVNLAELQKQTQKFDELITAIKDANPGVLL